jgi:hypothetical protein
MHDSEPNQFTPASVTRVRSAPVAAKPLPAQAMLNASILPRRLADLARQTQKKLGTDLVMPNTA